jgi:uncharacterized protein YjdB
MSYIFATIGHVARRWGWIALFPALAVCATDISTGTLVTPPPKTISDLAVGTTSETSVTLSFTQVDDGSGQPANYNVRFASRPISWGSASSAASGSCATPVMGTGEGSALSCTVLGLSPSTAYDFQVAAFRGNLSSKAVFGGPSNIAEASTSSSQVVTTVTVSPAGTAIAVGASSALQDTVKDQYGSLITGQAVTWSTDNPLAATVNSSGVVSGIGAGTATITAALSGKSGTAAITVTAGPPPPPVVTTVAVTPGSASVIAGSTVSLQATVKDQYGSVMAGQSVTWSTSNAAAATVNPSGVVTGVAAGTATITATSSGQSGTAAITVTAPPPPPVVTTVTVLPGSASVVAGSTVSLQATVKDQYGSVMTGQSVAWSTSNPAAATVNPSGVVTGVAAGSATITATTSGKLGTAAITVTAPPPPPVVTTVTVLPGSASVMAGSTVSLQATVKDQYGTVMTGQSVTWSTSNPAAATVNSSGIVTGVATGSATITATTSGKSGTAAITVVAAPPPGALADPTLLPRATGQPPAAGTYGRSLAAGQTYTDPLTGVLVLKLTSASVPNSNGGVYAGYSEGGPNISQPWVAGDGHTYYTANLASAFPGWLVDIRYDTFTPSNWRRSPTNGEITYAFSLDPATPQILYYYKQADGKVHRYNTATNADADTGVFPWLPAADDGSSSLTWLQVNLNDTWIVGMYNSTHTTVAKRLSDGLERTFPHGIHTVDEPHVDREYPVVYIGCNDPTQWQNVPFNLETGLEITKNDPGLIDSYSHEGVLRGRTVGINYNYGVVSVDHLGVVTLLSPNPTPTNRFGNYHFAGQWVFNNPNQWFTVDQFALADTPHSPIYLGMIGFVNVAGDVRILAAYDGIGTGYDTGGDPHPTLAPDGKLVMWTSNMNGSGRSDVFVARVPTR